MSGEEEHVPHDLVADKYRLSRLLGRGGMGSVWEGVHTSLGTRVAVKFIESEYADSPDARNRFENEARAAATLTSKHVVQVYDHGVMPDGRPYIVMEFLAGEPLDSRLDRVGRLSPQDTARIMTQVARALTKAHQAGIVHRDLKPENVFLVWDDEDNADVAKVVDFGIAKFTNADMGLSSSTRTGSVLGTPYFMSPEQARGLRTVDYRTDLWALGVITFRCMVGVLPFSGEAVGDLLVKICTAPIPVPSQVAPDLPPGFDAWFAKALDREPANRFASAQEMVEALADSIGGRSAMGSHVGDVAPPPVALPVPGHAPTAGGYQAPPVPVGGQAGPAQTADAFHVTPPQGVPRKSSAALIAAAVIGMLVLAGGGVGLALTFGGSAAASGVEESDVSAEPVESAGPEVAPIEEETLADKPSATETEELADKEKEEEKPEAGEAPKPIPSAAPTPRPVSVPRPVARPRPRPEPVQTAAPRPAPTAAPRPADELDVGY